MSKYDPLRRYLEQSGRDSVLMTFDQISELVGGLPSSTYRHLAWWANESAGRHVQARAWMGAGYQTESVDLAGRTVGFLRN